MIDSTARTVIGVARTVLSGLDLDEVLERVLGAARDLTDARYAALGVLDDERAELSRFLTLGIDDEDAHRIGPLPRGRGVLGELIRHPEPLRVADVSAHPHSYGFPLAHPPMRSFLGVPIFIDDEPFGNLYLTEKAGGEEFSEDDEEAVVLLAGFAGLAIDHARRYGDAEERGERLQRAVEALDVTVTISRTLAAQTDLEVILDLVAKRGRALVEARALVIELAEGDDLEVAAAAGEVPPGVVGLRVNREDSVAGTALRSGETQRLDNEANRARYREYGLGRRGLDADAGLVVPLLLRGETYGALIAVDRLEDGPQFSEHDKDLLESFAASAAVAVATARFVNAEHRRQRLEATEAERARWARELHDETLQGLAALRLSLGAARGAEASQLDEMLEDADRRLAEEIAKVQGLVTDLRPPALDELGVEAALAALAGRLRERGVAVELTVDLAFERGRAGERLASDLETAVYRIVQEALNNAADHGSPDLIAVTVSEDEAEVRIAVDDDGDGFDSRTLSTGFGLRSMRERAELLSGSFSVETALGEGTRIRAALPASRGGRGLYVAPARRAI